ncbi:MAG TPA: EamA family transporter [Acidimicrobiales bacterium]|nr:EamA family transporter [Acidimicrobiales bacterium]
MTRRGRVLFVSLGVIWGLPYLLIKIAVRQLDPAFLVLVRTAGGALLLVPVAWARGELRPALRFLKPLVCYTIAELAVPWWLLFDAERHVASSLAGLLVASVPLVSAVLAALAGGEAFGLRRVAGLLVGFGGVATLVGFDAAGSSVLAALSIGVVAIGYAVGAFVVGRHLQDAPRLGIVALSLALCAAGYAPIAAFEVPSHLPAGSVLWSAAALTVVCTAVAFVLAFALIEEVGAVRATVVTYLNPAVALVLGVVVLGEPAGPATLAGLALILFGSFLATGAGRSRSAGSAP